MVKFAYPFIATKDVAPDQPIFRYIFKKKRLTEEQKLWMSFLYMVYSSIPSTLAAFRIHPTPAYPNPEVSRLFCAVERRGFRNPTALLRHWSDAIDRFSEEGSLVAWITKDWTDDPEANYELFWKQSQTIWGNGRWAAFSWAELLKKTNDLNISAPDMRLEFCSGPKAGLCAICEVPETTPVPILNEHAINLRLSLYDHGFSNGLDEYTLDWETMETLLCDYNKFTKGTYAIGDHIREVWKDVVRAGDSLWAADAAMLWEARAETLPHGYLQERGCR